MNQYLIVIEKTRTGFSAYCPYLPGCVATAKTKSGIVRSMKSAITHHLEALRGDGLRIPTPKASSAYLEVKAA